MKSAVLGVRKMLDQNAFYPNGKLRKPLGINFVKNTRLFHPESFLTAKEVLEIFQSKFFVLP